MLEMGALHLSKYKDHALKLKNIYDKCSQLIETYSPDVMAVEARKVCGFESLHPHIDSLKQQGKS